MKKWLSNRTINQKMWIMVFLTLGNCLILGLIFFSAKAAEKDIAAKADTDLTRRNLTHEITKLFLRARRMEKDFLLLRQDTFRDRHGVISDELASKLQSLQSMETSALKDELIENIIKVFGDYRKQFEAISTAYLSVGLNEDDGLQGSLRKSVHQVEEKLKEFDKPRLGYLMLMMRRHEKDFLMRQDTKYIDRMALRKQEFYDLLPKSGIGNTDRNEIRDLMEAYHNDFNQMAEGWLKIEKESKMLDNLYEQATPDMNQLMTTIQHDYQASRNKMVEIQSQSTTAVIISFILVFVLSAALALLIGNDLRKPVTRLSVAMTELAKGSLDVKIEEVDRADELGQMARAAQTFKENMQAMERMKETELMRQKEQAKEREQWHEQSLERNHETHALVMEFDNQVKRIIDSLSLSSNELKDTASVMNELADEARSNAEDVKQSSDLTSSKVQAATSSVQELAESTEKIAERIHESARMAREAVTEAKATNKVVSDLRKASEQVGQVMGVIHKIAGQTNLLALNATIESARAGEAGRGFAVVAGEVKKLSAQTSQALEQIGAHIDSLQEASEKMESAIKHMDVTISKLEHITGDISTAVDKQGKTNQAIARNVNEASLAVVHIADGFGDASKRATQTGETANQVLGISGNVYDQTVELKEEINRFLAKIDEERTTMDELTRTWAGGELET